MESTKYKYLKNDYKYSIVLKSHHRITKIAEYSEWSLIQIGQIENIIKSLGGIMKNAFPVFYGKPGVPSDLDGFFCYTCTNLCKFLLETPWMVY